jgi:hypothetical protein
MKRTLNPTGKIRLTQDQVWAEFSETSHRKTVKVDWDLSAIELNSNWEMIAEVFASDSIRKVIPSPLQKKGSHLIELGDTLSEGLVRLTLRLVDAADPLRRIAAETAPIFLNSDASSSRSLLKTQRKSDLQTLWAIDFAFGEPVLQILNIDNSYRELTSSQLFLSTVLPSAVERILELVITDEDSFDAEPLAAWENFFSLLGFTNEELVEFRISLSESSAVELITTLRQRAQEISRIYSTSFKLTESTLFAEEF